MTLIGCTHLEAVNTLRHADDEIAMTICDGFCDVTMSRDVPCVNESVVLSRHYNTLASRHSSTLSVDDNTPVPSNVISQLINQPKCIYTAKDCNPGHISQFWDCEIDLWESRDILNVHSDALSAIFRINRGLDAHIAFLSFTV